MSGYLMITSNFNYKEPDVTTDLDLLRDDPPASIKYVANQNQLNLISVTVIFHLFVTVYCFTTNVEVSILRHETVDVPNFTGYKQKKDFLSLFNFEET